MKHPQGFDRLFDERPLVIRTVVVDRNAASLRSDWAATLNPKQWCPVQWRPQADTEHFQNCLTSWSSDKWPQCYNRRPQYTWAVLHVSLVEVPSMPWSRLSVYHHLLLNSFPQLKVETSSHSSIWLSLPSFNSFLFPIVQVFCHQSVIFISLTRGIC